MNYRRPHRRYSGRSARTNSSPWSYPKLERGDPARGRPGTARRIEHAIVLGSIVEDSCSDPVPRDYSWMEEDE